MTTIHASCVRVGGRGILIRGASGAGKSRLARLVLLKAPLFGLPAALVADDRVETERSEDLLVASCPAALQGLLEIRGLGLVRFPFEERTHVDLVLDLLPEGDIPRLPEPKELAVPLCGVTLPRAFAPTPETGLEVLLTVLGHAGAWLDPDLALASVRIDGNIARL